MAVHLSFCDLNHHPTLIGLLVVVFFIFLFSFSILFYVLGPLSLRGWASKCNSQFVSDERER